MWNQNVQRRRLSRRWPPSLTSILARRRLAQVGLGVQWVETFLIRIKRVLLLVKAGMHGRHSKVVVKPLGEGGQRGVGLRTRPLSKSQRQARLFGLGRSGPCVAKLSLICFSQHRVIVNDDLENDGKNPAPLKLPFGKLFFGFNIPPYVPPSTPEDESVSKVCFNCIYRLLVAHSSSPPPPSLAPVILSMDEPPIPPPKARARARLQMTRGLRTLTKQDGAQVKGEA